MLKNIPLKLMIGYCSFLLNVNLKTPSLSYSRQLQNVVENRVNSLLGVKVQYCRVSRVVISISQ